MLTFLEFMAEDARLDTIRDVNITNRIAGVKRSVDFAAGDPSKLNYPKNSVGQIVEPVKPKMKSIPSDTGIGKSNTPVGSMPKAKTNTIPSGTGVGRSDTPVGSMPKAKPPSITSGTGIGRSNTPVGSMPKAKPPSITSGTGIGRSNTPVGSMPKAKTKKYKGMKDAWEKIDRFPGEGGSRYNTTKGDKATPDERTIRKSFGKSEIEDRIKNQPKLLRFDRDTPEKLKKDAEQTWNIKSREPKDSKISNMYAGGSVKDRLDISSPKETLKTYTKRRKGDTDKWYIPDKTDDIDLISAKGYDVAKDPKTGLPDIKNERNPRFWGSYNPSNGRLRVRKDPLRGKPTTAHEYGHTGSVYYNRNVDSDTEEMRQREMDARKNTGGTSNAKLWWDYLYKGKTNFGRKKLSAPLGDRDRISIEKLNDRLIDKSRTDLSQKYFRGGRESHTDTDLKKAAFGNILPYANKEFDKKPIDPKTGNANQLNFPKTTPSTRKDDAIARQKDYTKLGHYSIRNKVFNRTSEITNVSPKFPDRETGNPDQLKFPSGKKN